MHEACKLNFTAEINADAWHFALLFKVSCEALVSQWSNKTYQEFVAYLESEIRHIKQIHKLSDLFILLVPNNILKDGTSWRTAKTSQHFGTRLRVPGCKFILVLKWLSVMIYYCLNDYIVHIFHISLSIACHQVQVNAVHATFPPTLAAQSVVCALWFAVLQQACLQYPLSRHLNPHPSQPHGMP